MCSLSWFRDCPSRDTRRGNPQATAGNHRSRLRQTMAVGSKTSKPVGLIYSGSIPKAKRWNAHSMISVVVQFLSGFGCSCGGAKSYGPPTIFPPCYCLAIRAMASFLYLSHRKREESGGKNNE